MKFTLIISIATLATTFDLVAADNGRQRLRKAKAESKASKGHKSGKGSKTSTPSPVEPTSTKCDNGSLYLCNDYVAVDEKYKYGYGEYGIDNMNGAEVMSGIPGVHPSIASKFELVPHNITNDAFRGTLTAVGMHPALGANPDGPSTFGDKGYDNPGRGGINNYDIFYLNSTITLTSFGNYTVNATGDPCNPKVDTNSGCHMQVDDGLDAKRAPWWSFLDDTKGLSLIESKDQVSQVCWTDGFLQGLLCEFEEGTHVMVGMGSWRATSNKPAPIHSEAAMTVTPTPRKWFRLTSISISYRGAMILMNTRLLRRRREAAMCAQPTRNMLRRHLTITKHQTTAGE